MFLFEIFTGPTREGTHTHEMTDPLSDLTKSMTSLLLGYRLAIAILIHNPSLKNPKGEFLPIT